MAKKELLRFLMPLLLVLADVKALAEIDNSMEAIASNIEAEDLEFANNLYKQTNDKVWFAIKEKYQELLRLKDSKLTEKNLSSKEEYNQMASVINQDSNIKLRIFVSSSMSKNLLKSYYREAKKYRGYLVFNGLPKGSFKELLKLASEIAEDGDIGGMEIDDEAFKLFNVNSVPVVVLSKESSYELNQDQNIVFDRISGTVSIKLALEEFIRRGELAEEAGEILAK